MKGTTTTALAAIAVALAFTQGFAQQKGTFTDPRDKKKYATVKIGGLTWMAENLNHNAKGSKCGGTKPKKEQIDFEQELIYYLLEDKDTENCKKQGRLYDMATAAKACPAGWHLPRSEEWEDLSDNVGAYNVVLALQAKSIGGDDRLGFAALPGGSGYSNGYFQGGGYAWFGAANFAFLSENRLQIDAYKDDSTLQNVRCVQNGGLTSKEKAEAEKAKIEAEKAKIEAYIKANSGSFTDPRDKKAYKTIKIGAQTWMAENLNYDANGSKCFNNNPVGCDRYGKLYDWITAMNACPAGWHLPNDAGWDALMKAVGGADSAGSKLKAKSGWERNGNGRDEFGFSAAPGGQGKGGKYNGNGSFGSYWSATESKTADKANYRRMLYTSGNVGAIDDPKTNLFSVRCVQGKAPYAVPALPAAQQKPAQPAQSGGQEFCSIAMLKTCVAVPKGTCAMTGGKVVSKCP